MKTGKVVPLPFDKQSPEHQRVLGQIRGQDRATGTASAFLQTELKQGLSGAIEWTDVYVKQGPGPARNVSRCDGVNCSQPALSHDAKSLVFVKADG